MRPQINVRAASVEDAPALVVLWREIVSEAGPAGHTSEAPTLAAVTDRLSDVARDPSRCLLVGLDGDDVVGLACVVREPLTPLHEEMAARVSYFHVSEAHRRRGVGTALLAAVAAWAEQQSADHVVADCNPAARETNRFFTRAGFGPLLVQRTTPLVALRRRLAAGQPGADTVVARRASLRARARAHGRARVGARLARRGAG